MGLAELARILFEQLHYRAALSEDLTPGESRRESRASRSATPSNRLAERLPSFWLPCRFEW
jgi:hypothetical protein